MDTFLLAWGFLGLCLPGSGGTAETGKAPLGMRDVPVRPTFGFPGAVPVSRIDALRGNKFKGVHKRSAAPRSFRSTGFGEAHACGGAGMAHPRHGAQRLQPGVKGRGDGAALESCALVIGELRGREGKR